MKGQKYYLRLTMLTSSLFGIILPLALWVKDPTNIAIFFSSVWAIFIESQNGYKTVTIEDSEKSKLVNLQDNLVGERRFELPTSWSRMNLLVKPVNINERY